jgi:hypothetical protein
MENTANKWLTIVKMLLVKIKVFVSIFYVIILALVYNRTFLVDIVKYREFFSLPKLLRD